MRVAERSGSRRRMWTGYEVTGGCRRREVDPGVET